MTSTKTHESRDGAASPERSGGDLAPPCAALAALALLLFGGAAPVAAWQATLAGTGMARAVAVNGADQAVAVGTLATDDDTKIVAAKLDSMSGVPRWTKNLGSGAGTGVAVDASNDVAVVGRLPAGGIAVFKLSGDDGAEEWHFRMARARVADGARVPFGLAQNGDVYVAPTRTAGGGGGTVLVFRLERATGARLWKRKLRDQSVLGLALDAAGNPMILASGSGATRSTVTKLDRTKGKPLWKKPVALAPAAGIGARPNGDVAVAGFLLDSPDAGKSAVIDLAGADGSESWRFVVGSALDVSLAVASSGDVVAAADVLAAVAPPGQPPGTARAVAAVKIDGSGKKVWSKTITDPSFADCGASALALDGAGAPILGGCSTSGESGTIRLQLTKLKPDSGVVLWRRGIDGILAAPLDSAMPVGGIAFDSLGNVAAAGAVADDGGNLAPTVVKWDDTAAGDLLNPADRACAQAILSAGQTYLAARLIALEGCRDRINSGSLDLAPGDCPSDNSTRRQLDNAHTRVRRSIAQKCGAALPAGLSCAATLDELVHPDGASGCLIEGHDQIADQLVVAAYPESLAGASGSAATCQRAIGTATRRIFTGVAAALDACRARGILAVADCGTNADYRAALLDAAKRAKGRIKNACSGSDLESAALCSTSLDELVAPDGQGGCLFSSHRQGAEAAVAAES